jgi:hypothetical protein
MPLMENIVKKDIVLKIEGELGKYKTIPVDSLVKIAESLQELILSIARHDLPCDKTIDLNNFKLDLSGLDEGSVIPSFVFTPRVSPTIDSYEAQRVEVIKKFNRLMDVSDRGVYNDLKTIYPELDRRNAIVESLYDFTSCFGNSPVSIYEVGNNSTKIYSLKEFKRDTKNDLVGTIIKPDNEKTEELMVGSIRVTKTSTGKTRTKVQEVYPRQQLSLSYSPETISVNNKKYILNYPLRCLFDKEEDYYVINNEQLDIIGTGLSREDAETNFNEEFDYLYVRLNSLIDNHLSNRLLGIKLILNNCVKVVQ